MGRNRGRRTRKAYRIRTHFVKVDNIQKYITMISKLEYNNSGGIDTVLNLAVADDSIDMPEFKVILEEAFLHGYQATNNY